MIVRSALVLLVLVVGFGACAGPSPKEIQRRRAEALRPEPLDGGPPWSGPLQTLRVRVYADEGHRKAILGWQVRFVRVVERVNPVLRSALGAQLEVVTAEEWNRPQSVGGLIVALSDLVRHDPGRDVDLVIGLVTPLPTVTRSHIELGRARMLGRHIVMRPGDDLKQFDDLARGLNRLETEEREELYLALRRHRAALVLLHEIGHVLGALHSTDLRTIMAPLIGPKISSFGPENLRLMRTTLAARLAGRRQPMQEQDTLAKYRAVLEATEGRLDPEARARMLSILIEGPARLTRVTQTDLHPLNRTPAQSADDVDLANRAAAMAAQSPAAAWTMLKPILDRNLNDASLQLMGCQVALRRDEDGKTAVEQCSRAVQLAPHEIRPLLLRAAGRGQAQDLAGAIKDARAVQDKLTSTSTAPVSLWRDLARVYQSISAVTWAEAAADRGQDDSVREAIAEWSQSVRKAYFLPKDAAKRGVSPEQEPVYLDLRARIAAAAAAENLARTKSLEAELTRRFPRMVQRTAACRVLVAKKQWRQAWPRCRAAAKSAPKSADAQTLLAVAAFGIGRPDAAVGPLRRALRLAPDRADVWRLLAAAYRASGDAKGLKRLQSQYQQRFGQPLTN